MKLILITHPDFLGSNSMPRFATMLANGMNDRGHEVVCWKAKPLFSRISKNKFLQKWLGYIDQYLIFSAQIRMKLYNVSGDTLFAVTDHALGPYISLVDKRPHVVHCHDFLAQKSALGIIAENPTSWTGKIYQSYIRRGYSKGKNFISVSNKTKSDLAQFVSRKPCRSEVVYNGVNSAFRPQEPEPIRKELSAAIGTDLTPGYLLHVGGNQWYKNREGVIRVYNAWRDISQLQLPLLLVGSKPNPQLKAFYEASPFRSNIHLLSGMNDEFVRKAYSGASLFVFPSLAEGFGWPIAEAMASGCPVITTNEAPMTEVAGGAAILIPRMPKDASLNYKWALHAALKVEDILHFNNQEREEIISQGLENVKRFDAEKALDQIESVYIDVLLNPQRLKKLCV